MELVADRVVVEVTSVEVPVGGAEVVSDSGMDTLLAVPVAEEGDPVVALVVPVLVAVAVAVALWSEELGGGDEDGSLSLVLVLVVVMGIGSVSVLGGAWELDEKEGVPVIWLCGGEPVVDCWGSPGWMLQKSQNLPKTSLRYARRVSLRSAVWSPRHVTHRSVLILN